MTWRPPRTSCRTAFEQLQRRWPRLRDDASALAYARSCVLNGCRSVHRRTAVARKHAPRLAAGAAAGPDTAEVSAEHDAMMTVLRSLPRRQRERQVLTTEAARTQPGMLRPPPTPALSPTRRAPARRSGRPGWPRSRRWVAPAAAAAAVVAIIGAVSLAGIGGKPAPATGTGAAAMPRFYVSVIFRPQARAAVHNARTGRVLSSIMLPKALHLSRDSASGHVAAAASDRTFAITATENLGHLATDVRVLLLRVSPDGRTDRLTVTPLRLTRPGMRDFVNGIALSPDGSKLPAAVQIPTDSPAHHTPPYGEIKVVSLAGSFPARTWTTRQQYALPLSPSWEANGRYLGFVWDGHITGPALKHIGVTQVRLLDTAAPGTDILASKILAQGSPILGVIQTGSWPLTAALSSSPRPAISPAARERAPPS